jgi:dTDP-4-amino-4,6-dideoxyglucose
MEPYRSEHPDAGRQLPHTIQLAGRVLALPTGSAIGPDDVQTVCELVRFAVAHGHEIAERLSAGGRS